MRAALAWCLGDKMTTQQQDSAIALGAGLAALGGIAIAPVQYASYDMGLMLGLKGFMAAIMGGLTNPAGAILGGLLLGALEALGGGVNSASKDAIAFVILIVVLVFRRMRQPHVAAFSWGEL
jgi:branched-chain amino acid transport system permease protein